MAGAVKKTLPVSRSMAGSDFFFYFNADISIALEYTGSPVNNTKLLKVFAVDVHSIRTAKMAVSPSPLYNLSLPVVDPIVKTNFRVNDESRLTSRADNSRIHLMSLNNELRFSGDANGDFIDESHSSSTLGFSGSSEDHSHDLSESSDMLETPVYYNEIQVFQDSSMYSDDKWNDDGSVAQYFGIASCEEEEASDHEHLECRRKKKGAVTFCDHQYETVDVAGEEESIDSDHCLSKKERERERPVPERPPKKGMCYHCHTGNRFTEKESCLVCDAKYCRHCIRKAMGSMPEGRKCLTCIGFAVDESKRKMLGKSSHILRRGLKEEEVRQIMLAERSCIHNQLPPERISVNGRQLCLEELMLLHSCPNPPMNLKPGSYWYERVSGLWGKEGHKPCQIITPELNVGEQRIMLKASNENTDVMINGREITKADVLVLKSAGVMCEGKPNFWLQEDGTYRLDGMKMEKKNIWGRKRTKLLCALLFLPTLDTPNPRGRSNRVAEGALSNYLEQKALCEMLLVGNDCSGTSTFYKQARVLYDIPFSEEERQNIKFMIRCKLYRYLGRLLGGREVFEEESLLEKERQSTESGPSDLIEELQGVSKYSVGKKLKDFSDRFIDIMLSSNMDLSFPTDHQDFASCVEELSNDAAIQETYNRLTELQLAKVASYLR